MKKLLSALLPLCCLCLLPACGVETADGADDEDVATAGGALVGSNALISNALISNALISNALISNALISNALTPEALAALQADSEEGALARMFVRYVVSCALEPEQSFSFSWPDSSGVVHAEQYWGSLGIAPGWATAPLTDVSRQKLVSACLAARTNYYGVSVEISVRSNMSPLKPQVGSAELAEFPIVEGAFWGNLFAEDRYLNACYYPANVDAARAAQRDCAAGHLVGGTPQGCGMITIVGPCTTWCDPLKGAGQYYPRCVDHPGVSDSPYTTAVITTALQ